ncbi:MAG TPA: hypothetical protein VK638_14240 [Edaphobacter sp.]|nr:hypothetical protein [Edaphobacter sp.]
MRYFLRAGICSVCVFTLAMPVALRAQEPRRATAGPEGRSPSSNEVSDVVHLIGLPDAKPGIKGVLKLTPEALDFSTADIHALIPYKRITAVSVGNERMEAGGQAGNVARRLPLGIGPAFSIASQKQVDLFTIEFRDPHEGYHGAVFLLPLKRTAELKTRIAAEIPTPAAAAVPACNAGARMLNSVLIAPLEVTGVDLPAEYRVLLYENLYNVLRTTRPSDSYLRTGDISAGPGCTALTLHVSVVGFRKGNQALRAATGPLGMFVGTTSITFNVKLDDGQGKTILDASVKKSKHGDTNSLAVARDIAKNISKRIDKAVAKS